MASLTAVGVMASLAVTAGTDLRHSDIPTAFIQSNLDSQILKLPPVQEDGKHYTAVRLMRALYGLKQSPQLWNKLLTIQ